MIVRDGVAEKITAVLQTYFGKAIKFDVVTVDDEDDLATAESLKLLKDKIKVFKIIYVKLKHYLELYMLI